MTALLSGVKDIRLGIAILLITTSTSLAQDSNPAPSELWFPVGESLIYDMHWGVVHVGYTKVTTEWIEEDHKKRIAIRFVTRTNKFFDKIYRVEDLVESIIDPVSFLPVRFSKSLREGSYEGEELTTFDYEQLTARWETKTEQKSKEYVIEPGTRDVVAFMYLMRQKTIEPGEKNRYQVAGDEAMSEIMVEAMDIEKIETEKYGRISCIKILPRITADALFIRKMPQRVWVSCDSRKILVKMDIKVPIAYITLTLNEVDGPGDDFWVTKKK